MTPERAVEVLNHINKAGLGEVVRTDGKDYHEALDIAIKVLEMQIRTELDCWNEPPMGGFKEE